MRVGDLVRPSQYYADFTSSLDGEGCRVVRTTPLVEEGWIGIVVDFAEGDFAQIYWAENQSTILEFKADLEVIYGQK